MLLVIAENNWNNYYGSRGDDDSEFSDNFLLNPSDNTHIILLYDTRNDLNTSVSKYLNEGLKRNQICVHASYYAFNKDYIEKFSQSIDDFEKNIERGNLLIIDLSSYYISAITGDLSPFNNLKKKLNDMLFYDDRKDQHIRLTGDCATLLLENRHFKESIMLEEWWHSKPFNGSYLCPYPRTLLNQFPHNIYLSRILHEHDVVINSKGTLMNDFMRLKYHRLQNT